MGGFFARLRGGGGASNERPQPSRVTDQDRAVLELKNQRDKLKKYQKKVDALTVTPNTGIHSC